MKRYKFLISIIVLLFASRTYADQEKIFDIDLSKGLKITIKEVYLENKTTSLPNGEIVFGSTNNPKSYVKEIVFKAFDKEYKLESKYMYNAWHNRPKEIPKVIKYIGAHCYDSKNCTIRGLFSDAGGSFVAEWMIIRGMPIRTVITNSSDIINVFATDITPPVYE